MDFCDKLDCLSLASLTSLAYYLQVRLEPTQAKNLSGAPLYVRLLASPPNVRPGWKGLLGKNALAYCENPPNLIFVCQWVSTLSVDS